MSQYSDDEQYQARVARSLADSLADYTPPVNGELRLPNFDEFAVDEALDDAHEARLSGSRHVADEEALLPDNPVPPVQNAFDGWSTSFDQVDSGIKAEPDDFRVRPQGAGEIESSFDITRVFSETGSKLQRQGKEWGSATVAVFAARKEQHNLVWLGVAALVAIVALIWLFKPSAASQPQEHVISIAPQTPNQELLNPPATAQPQAVVTAPTVIGAPVADTNTQALAQRSAVAQPEARAVQPAAPAPRGVDQAIEKSVKPAVKSTPAARSAPAVKGGYTVQIAAAHNEANIKALAAKLSKPGEAQIVRSWRDGKPWYVLTYGHYKNHDEATRARNALPAAIKNGNAPWIKEL